MPNVERMLQDFMKGAQESQGFMPGRTPGVELLRLGTEEKLASIDPGFAAAIGTAVPLPGTGPAFSALAAPDGRKWPAALGAMGGGVLGGVTGALGGTLADHLMDNDDPELARIIAYLGAIGGAGLGAHYAAKPPTDSKTASALDAAYLDGIKLAVEQFKLAEEEKTAIFGTIGSFLGSQILGKGLGAFASRFGGAGAKGLLGRAAGWASRGANFFNGGGTGAQMVGSTLGGMAGGAVDNRLSRQPA